MKKAINLSIMCLGLCSSWASEKKDDFFEKTVVPIIRDHCIRCHKPENKKGKLSLATLADWIKGGKEGPAAVPFKAEQSLVIEQVSPYGTEAPEMPEEGKPLTVQQIDDLKKWINTGMVWPEPFVIEEKPKADKNFWSLQAITKVSPPSIEDAPKAWTQNPIDLFTYAKMKEQQLSPSIPATKQALIRRACFDLHGLPPTPDMIKAFVNDSRPDAYERLIDELLNSERYGERWGRHWLDVVRFAESSGFERNIIRDNAWPFRDYVIKSFNQDKPFDQFIKEHLAGDQLIPDDPEREVGTAFLVAGAYDDVGNQDVVAKKQIRANTLDDIIAATGSAFLGMSVNCARCHDHKFDPIQQSDYYRLRAAFEGVDQGSRIIAKASLQTEHKQKTNELNHNIAALQSELDLLLKEPKQRVAEQKQELLKSYPREPVDPTLTEENFESTQAKFVRLKVSAPYGFSLEELEVWSDENPSRNIALKSNGGQAHVNHKRYSNDDPEAYGAHHLIDGFYGSFWIPNGANPTATIELKQNSYIHRVAFSNNRTNTKVRAMPTNYVIETSIDGLAWTQVASHQGRKPSDQKQLEDLLLNEVFTDAERTTRTQLLGSIAKLKAELKAIAPLPTVWAGKFNATPPNTFLLQGGDVSKEKQIIKPASLSFLHKVQTTFQLEADAKDGDRRLALANWMVAADNPLTARVLVNRIWQYHFGRGIVATPSDFGYMGSRPTHPELLDYLALQLQQQGWKIKALHRLIMTSQTYRQSSRFNQSKADLDADSAYLWRYPPRRLEAEAIRDTLLYIAGMLDLKMYGSGFRLYQYTVDNVATYYPLEQWPIETYRRSVYHQTPRSVRIDLMTEFDMPDCSLAKPKRDVTVSPLQALTLQNHNFAMAIANDFSKRIQAQPHNDLNDQINYAYALAFSREPEADELDYSKQLIDKHGWVVFCRALINTNEVIYVD